MKHLVIVLIVMLCAAPAWAEKREKYSWEKDLKHRLLRDFSKTHDEVKKYIQGYLPYVTDEDMAEWEQTRALEVMTINGEKRYFHSAGPNLFRIDSACVALKRYITGPVKGAHDDEDLADMHELFKTASSSPNHTGAPKTMRVTYTLTVNADAVPSGEKIRCWLPLPREDFARQQDVKLISTSEKHFKRSPEAYHHSSVYMEKKAQAGKPTVFSETFEYTVFGQWFNLKPEDVKPYDTSSKLYKEYTSEREKHIIFTPELRRVADSLTSGTYNPLLKARKIFAWINDTKPWASAREYSTIDNIPMYVLQNGHGDCGQQTLLFLTLCRICGIPGHFQSGFRMQPSGWNLHDWCEIYFEGIGWVPVDQSFGFPDYASNDDEHWFFLGGMDAWRMVVNDDYGMPLYPKKKYPRSETVDFQRGEVEWAGGNLYFDQWRYNMKIEYLKQ